MSTFRVKKGGSILTKKNDVRKPGETVTLEEIGEAHKEMLRDGKIEQIEGAAIKVEPSKEPKAPELTAMKVKEDGTLAPRESATQTITDIDKPTNTAPVLTGIWTCAPETLLEKSLEELNAMIIERDPKIPPFDDKAEAIACLSQDFKR